MTGSIRTHGREREAGFSLLELTLVSAMLSLVMGIVAMSFRTSTDSLAADDLVAKATETLQRSTMRIAQIARPCALTTYRVASIAADIPLYATAVGEMIEPPNDGEARSSIRFQSADGIVSMNAALLTAPRTFWLQLENGELDNDLDDDGDGMVDEARVVWLPDVAQPAREVVLCTNVRGTPPGELPGNGVDDDGNGLVDERGLAVLFDGSRVELHLSVERRGADGRSFTRTVTRSIALRN